MTRLRCRLTGVSLPAERPLDTGDLARMVERELAQLLALAPAPARPGPIAVAGGRLEVAGPYTAGTVAQAIARHVHAGLLEPR